MHSFLYLGQRYAIFPKLASIKGKSFIVSCRYQQKTGSFQKELANKLADSQ